MKINQLPLQLNQNFNLNSPFGVNDSKSVDIKEGAVKNADHTAQSNPVIVSLTGGNLFKAKKFSALNEFGIYSKDSLLNSKPLTINSEQPLQDFSLSGKLNTPLVSDINQSRKMSFNPVEPANAPNSNQSASNDKIVISDSQMDQFLRSAFRLFDME